MALRWFGYRLMVTLLWMVAAPILMTACAIGSLVLVCQAVREMWR